MKTVRVIFVLLTFLAPLIWANPVFGIPAECETPGEPPVRMIDWQWSAGSPGWYRLALQDEYIFVSDMFNQRVIRYAINGGTPENWAIIPGTLQSNPSDVHINPVTGDLYVAGFSTDPRVLVFDPAGSGTPKDTLFTGSPGPDPGDMVGSGFPIATHPVTGDLYVVDEDTITVGQQVVWISRIQRFTPDGMTCPRFCDHTPN
jgi:DNA-binding beta-propeller fold protein YncE